jgi:multiple sugar transport system permease protein
MGAASALSWILFAIIMAFTFVQMKLQKKWVNYDD